MIICARETLRNQKMPITIYRFELDPKGGWCYRSRTSHNAFFHSTKGRNWFPNSDWSTWEVLYSSKDQREIDFEVKILKDCGVRLEINYIECESIWDFYKKIGWDYKTKKWSRND